MIQILHIAQIIVSVLLIASILLQQRGGGLSQVFGGEGGGAYRTRRGIEKTLFIATIILGVIFLAMAFLNFIV